MDRIATIGIIVAQDPVSYNLCHSFYHTYLVYPQETVARYGATFLTEHARVLHATVVVRLKRMDGLLWECLHSGIQHFILSTHKPKPKQAHYYKTLTLFIARTYLAHICKSKRYCTIKIMRLNSD